MWILVPGLVRGRMTHWQRSAEASPHNRWACTLAHGLPISMTRSAGRSVSGRSAASRARSIPYFAIRPAALAVSAWASAGVTPAASALTSSLRTRASNVSGASVATGVPPVLRHMVEYSAEGYRRAATVPPGTGSTLLCGRGSPQGEPRSTPRATYAGKPATTRLGLMAVQMAPSILSADFARLADEAAAVAGVADWLHVDVMDYHFVPNLTVGLPVVEALLKHTGLPLDCHLMISEPDRWAPGDAEAGARNVTVHAEALPSPVRTLRLRRAAGA